MCRFLPLPWDSDQCTLAFPKNSNLISKKKHIVYWLCKKCSFKQFKVKHIEQLHDHPSGNYFGTSNWMVNTFSGFTSHFHFSLQVHSCPTSDMLTGPKYALGVVKVYLETPQFPHRVNNLQIRIYATQFYFWAQYKNAASKSSEFSVHIELRVMY